MQPVHMPTGPHYDHEFSTLNPHKTTRGHVEGVVLPMPTGIAAATFRTATNFIAIAYLRLGKLTHLPKSPFVPAMPKSAGLTTHRA